MGRAGPWPRNLPKIGNKLFLFFGGEKGKKKKKTALDGKAVSTAKRNYLSWLM